MKSQVPIQCLVEPATGPFKTLEAVCPMTRRHISQALNLQNVLLAGVAYSSTLKMGASVFFETMENLYRLHGIPSQKTVFFSHRCENLKVFLLGTEHRYRSSYGILERGGSVRSLKMRPLLSLSQNVGHQLSGDRRHIMQKRRNCTITKTKNSHFSCISLSKI
jgi:hypothetical protein